MLNIICVNCVFVTLVCLVVIVIYIIIKIILGLQVKAHCYFEFFLCASKNGFQLLDDFLCPSRIGFSHVMTNYTLCKCLNMIDMPIARLPFIGLKMQDCSALKDEQNPPSVIGK